MRSITTVIALLLLVTCSVAQLSPGDMGIAALGSEFWVLQPNGTVTAYAVPSFGGYGPAQSILWDPANPCSFIIGGMGFVGRATVTGSTATYVPFSTTLGHIAQMSWSSSGSVLLIEKSSPTGDQGRILELDPASGNITSIRALPVTPNAGAVHPVSGDLYVGNLNAIVRYTAASGFTQEVPVVANIDTSGSWVTAIEFDPANGDVFATTYIPGNRVMRVSGSTVTDLVPPQSIYQPNALSIDPQGDLVVMNSVIYSSITARLIPLPSGSVQILGTVPAGGAGIATGVSVVQTAGSCTGTSGGPEYQVNQPEATLLLDNLVGTPTTPATANLSIGQGFTLALTSTLPGNSWDFGVGTAPLVPRSAGGLALPDGQVLNLDVTDPTLVRLFGGFSGPGFVPISVNAAFPTPVYATAQFAVADPTTSSGVRLSQPSTLIVQ